MNFDYPRMLFHRTKPAVTVRSREEEDALGAGWSRTIWPPGAPAPDPAADAQPPAPRVPLSARQPAAAAPPAPPPAKPAARRPVPRKKK